MGLVQCQLCPTECVLREYESGACGVRLNRGGELISLVYGQPCAANIDPIEKKPFYHFLPGSKAFSIATVGCVLRCRFCQNWEISQARPEDADHYDLPPSEVVRMARGNGCASVTYTYTEPTVFYEYMYDTAQKAKEAGLRNTMHSCGYINREPLLQLCQRMDAADVDLKAFNDDFYARICGGRLSPVLNSIVRLREQGVWLELTNLVIPTLNDNMKEIRAMCRWIVDNTGADTPLHLSRFFPHYRLRNLPPTPPRTLWLARRTALEAGLRFVYIGNMRSEAENTFCPSCNTVLIERRGYDVVANRLISGRCPKCSRPVAGVWR